VHEKRGGRSQFEPEARRLATECLPPGRFRLQRGRQVVALSSEREPSRALLCLLPQLFRLPVGAFERVLVKGDLRFELGVPPAVPPVEAFELPLGGDELLGGALALSVDLLLLSGEPPDDGVAPLSALIERELLGGGAFEGAGGTFGRCDRVCLAERCLAFEQVAV